MARASAAARRAAERAIRDAARRRGLPARVLARRPAGRAGRRAPRRLRRQLLVRGHRAAGRAAARRDRGRSMSRHRERMRGDGGRRSVGVSSRNARRLSATPYPGRVCPSRRAAPRFTSARSCGGCSSACRAARPRVRSSSAATAASPPPRRSPKGPMEEAPTITPPPTTIAPPSTQSGTPFAAGAHLGCTPHGQTQSTRTGISRKLSALALRFRRIGETKHGPGSIAVGHSPPRRACAPPTTTRDITAASRCSAAPRRRARASARPRPGATRAATRCRTAARSRRRTSTGPSRAPARRRPSCSATATRRSRAPR